MRTIALLITALLLACFRKEETGQAHVDAQNTGYIIGVDIAARLKKQPLPIDLESVLAGISDHYQDRGLRIPLDSIYRLQEKMAKIGQSIEAEMSRNREQAMTFLDTNGRKRDVRKVSGIQYAILKTGKADGNPSDSDMVLCNLSCSLLNGTPVKDTWKTGRPERFSVGKAMPGIASVLKTMTKGMRVRAWVPPESAYGREGVRGSIPPYSLLVYDIELLDIGG